MPAPVLLQHLTDHLGALTVHPVSGGDINDCYRLDAHDRSYFLKVNEAERFPGMFEQEAVGLERSRSSSEFSIPVVELHGQVGDDQFLLMSYIQSAPRRPDYWEVFGRRLAQMHCQTSASFGGVDDNYIGSLPQSNRAHGRWPDFYWHERLLPQLEAAVKMNRLGYSDMRAAESLRDRLDGIFPSEPPALLHGDLWSGNQMADEKGEATIYDPAIYYGHREMDLAMMELFGGFDGRMIDAYEEVYPISPERQQRIDVAQLYPLLVHVNLFGGGYAGRVRAILSRFK